MFLIGELSRMARVSRRLLRYYEQRGLLRPARVDARTGYRYYGADEIAHLHRILALKELGLSLEEIARAVSAELRPESFRAILLERRAQVSAQLARDAATLRHIDACLAQMDQSDATPAGASEVLIRSEPAHRLLSIRQRVDSFDAARRHIALLRQRVPAQLPRGALGPLIAIVHSPEFEPDDIDVELGFLVETEVATVRLPDGRAATLREIDAVPEMAVCIRKGPPEQAHAASEAIARHIAARGYGLAGPNRELFLRLPSPGDPSITVVEMQYPVKARGHAEPRRG